MKVAATQIALIALACVGSEDNIKLSTVFEKLQMVTFSAPKINDLQFSKCILCVEPRFSAMMMSFESTIVSPLDGSFR